MAKQKTILWVDDELYQNQPYAGALEDQGGYRVLKARSVGEAKKLLGENQDIDFVILDVRIAPHNNDQDTIETQGGHRAGVVLGRWIKETHENLPFIGFSAGSLEPEVQEWFAKNSEGCSTRFAERTVEAFLRFVRRSFGEPDRKSTRLNSSHSRASRMPSSA